MPALAITRLVEMTNKRPEALEVESATRISSASVLLLSILALSLGAGIGSAILITNSITGPLKGAVEVAQAVAAGDLFSHIPTAFHDHPGQLMQALKRMNHSLESGRHHGRHCERQPGAKFRDRKSEVRRHPSG